MISVDSTSRQTGDGKDSLIHDDGDRIVQYALAEDDRVQLGVDLVLIEYGEDGDGICRR